MLVTPKSWLLFRSVYTSESVGIYISSEFLLLTLGNPYYAAIIVAITNIITNILDIFVLTKTLY